MSIIIAILIFGFIILFHEFGHFIFAKMFHVRVNEFMIGFGPRIFGIKKGETDFSIRPIPFGGACVMEGEDSESEDDKAFNKKPLYQRFLIVFAGPLFNFILAFLASIIFLSMSGINEPKIDKVVENYPAYEAGIRRGDTIKRLGNYNVNFYQEINYYTAFHRNETIKVTYERNGKIYNTKIIPKYDKKSKRYMMGIIGRSKVTKLNFFQSIKYGVYQLKEMVYVTLMSVKMLFTGKVSFNEMSGPVGIVKVIGDSYNNTIQYGIGIAIMQLLYMMILLSANLGVMNLLPIPALDGGRLFVFIIEAITHKKPSGKAENIINMTGFIILILLMVIITGNDILKLFFK